MRRKLAPFPLHLLIDNPRALALSAAGFGMLSRLICHYWMTDCKALPSSNDELRCIMRAHFATYKAYRSELLSIFAELEPELERSFQAYQNRRDNVLRLAQRGHATLRLKAIERQASRSPASELRPPSSPHRLRPPAPASEPPSSRSGSGSGSGSGAWHE